MKRLILFFLCIAMAGCAVAYVRGSGRIATVTKYYDNYHGVRLSGKGIVHLVQSENYRFTATADDNILKITDVTINNGILHISYLQEFSSTKVPEFIIEAPRITSIGVDGQARIITDNVLSSPQLVVKVNGAAQCILKLAVRDCEVISRGASQVELSGTGTRLTVKSYGAAEIKAFEFSAKTVELDIAGAGTTEVYADESLDVDLSGSARVLYAGNPHVKTEISGAGSLKPVDYTPKQVYHEPEDETKGPSEEQEEAGPDESAENGDEKDEE